MRDPPKADGDCCCKGTLPAGAYWVRSHIFIGGNSWGSAGGAGGSAGGSASGAGRARDAGGARGSARVAGGGSKVVAPG